MTPREKFEERERRFLAKEAALSVESKGRDRPEPECEVRTCFQRDRDRIIHSKSFRRLKHKTQVFLKPYGDHYRTRLTHTLEVGQIARTIARALNLNEDLTEAIAMGHDLGHTPFGHSGEAALNEIYPGGFRHPEQSLRVVETLERDGLGLNLTFEVRDGIAKHSKGMERIIQEDKTVLPSTLEGQVVRVSDIIAYVNHDIDDAIRAKILTEESIPSAIKKVLGDTHSRRISTMVRDVIDATLAGGMQMVMMTEPVCEATEELRAFLDERVYRNPVSALEFEKAKNLLKQLFRYFLEHLDEVAVPSLKESSDEPKRVVCDYIAGMTDGFAILRYQEIFLPKPWAAGM